MPRCEDLVEGLWVRGEGFLLIREITDSEYTLFFGGFLAKKFICVSVEIQAKKLIMNVLYS